MTERSQQTNEKTTPAPSNAARFDAGVAANVAGPNVTAANPVSGNAVASGNAVIVSLLERTLHPIVSPLGYEIVLLEALAHRQKTIRLFIDFAPPADPSADSHEPIGIDDCAKVSRAVDEPLEFYGTVPTTTGETDEFGKPLRVSAATGTFEPALKTWLQTGFELEVSSPGIDRPLRREQDFARFTGREIRLSTFRPLTADELGNAEYAAKNPKQKNFIGELDGVEAGASIRLKISPTMGSIKKAVPSGKKKSKSASKSATAAPVKLDLVHVPFALIAKANLEPDIDGQLHAHADAPIDLSGDEEESNPGHGPTSKENE